MLADKQGAKAIAALISEAEGRTVTAKEIEALAPPKGALSAFMMFANEHRLAMQERGEASTMASVTREASAQWGEMGDKSKYEALAQEDKERHDEEMATYRELLQSEAVEDRKAAGPSSSAAPSAAATAKAPNPDAIRKQLWERAGLKGAIRKFTPAERQTWTPLAQEKFREHKRMRDEGYANGQMLLWLAAHAGMPDPPKKAPRSAYVLFSAERCEEAGCSFASYHPCADTFASDHPYVLCSAERCEGAGCSCCAGTLASYHSCAEEEVRCPLRGQQAVSIG